MGEVVSLPVRAKPPVNRTPPYHVMEAAGVLLIREMFRQICSGEMSREEARIATDTIDRMLVRAKGERT